MKNTGSCNDDIQILISKDCYLLSNVMIFICNMYFVSGKFHNSPEIAKVARVNKSGHPKQMGNYKPVSVQPYLRKILEKSA